MGAEKKPKRAQVEPQAQIELKKAKKAQKVVFFLLGAKLKDPFAKLLLRLEPSLNGP